MAVSNSRHSDGPAPGCLDRPPPFAGGVGVVARGWAARSGAALGPVEVRCVIESMTGARFVHDTLEQLGWDVLIADAQKVKGLAPLACKTDRIDARVLAVLSYRDLVPEIWLPDPRVAQGARACPVSVASGQAQVDAQTPRPLDADRVRQALPGDRSVRRRRPQPARRARRSEPWRSTLTASLSVIDDLDAADRRRSTASCSATGADHPYVPLLMTAPGIGWVLAFTIAAEIGEIERFSSPKKLVGYSGLCPRVIQSGEKDRRGPLTKTGPKYLRWAMLEATMHALRHPAYAERYQHTKRRLGKQRGAKVAQIDIARRLTEAVWHMLTPTSPSPNRCRRRRSSSGRLTALLDLRPRSRPPIPPGPPAEEAIET